MSDITTGQDVDIINMSLGGTAISLGQTTAALSFPVVLANNSNPAVVGHLANNSLAPTSDNLGVLPAVATDAAPSWAEGKQTLLSVDLSGNNRITGSYIDNASFTIGGTNRSLLLGALVDSDNNLAAPLENTISALRMTASRALHVSLRGAGGGELGIGRELNFETDSLDVSGSLVQVTGSLITEADVATSAVTYAVIVSTSAARVAAVNSARKAICITNNSTGNLYIGTTALITSSGVSMGQIVGPGGSFNDYGFGVYIGERWAIYDTVATSANISVTDYS